MMRAGKTEIVIASVCVVLSLASMGLTWVSPIGRALLHGQRINGLVIGSDYEDNARHSDTLMAVSYDPQTRFIDLLSIPRDTMVSIPDMPRIRRINEVFTYEFRHSGKNFAIASLALRSVVEDLLSSGTVRGLSFPYFFTVDYQGFRTLIDAMGGVYVHVTEPMHYDDNWGNLHIHFEPGTYLLDGRKALEYVRFRGKSADQGRVFRQQIFVKELVQRLKSPIALVRLPRYSRILFSTLHTNISVWDAVALLIEARRVRWNNVRLFALPGTPNGNLWKMSPEGTQRIVSMMQQPAPQGKRSPARRGMATVEVWNASSHANAARAVMRLLRDKGFDVVSYGDFSSRQSRTLVIDRSGWLRPAQDVADVLLGTDPDVVSRPDTTRQVDVSVIIGNDCQIPEKRSPW